MVILNVVTIKAAKLLETPRSPMLDSKCQSIQVDQKKGTERKESHIHEKVEIHEQRLWYSDKTHYPHTTN